MSSGTTQLQPKAANLLELQSKTDNLSEYDLLKDYPVVSTIVSVAGVTLFGAFTLGVGYGLMGGLLCSFGITNLHSSIATTAKVNMQLKVAKVKIASCKIQDETNKTLKITLDNMAYTSSVFRSGVIATVALLASISSYYFYNYMLTTHGEECQGAKYSYISSTLVSVGAVINLFRTVIWDKK